jgi:hypothetical protein
MRENEIGTIVSIPPSACTANWGRGVKLTGLQLGYIFNFGAALIKDGIVRAVNELIENGSRGDAEEGKYPGFPSAPLRLCASTLFLGWWRGMLGSGERVKRGEDFLATKGHEWARRGAEWKMLCKAERFAMA